MAGRIVVDESGVFIISIAARMVEMHPQTLRKYERAGLLEPSRSDGNLRRYSADDIDRLHQIKHLVDDLGINLAGVQLALGVARQVQQLDDILAGTGMDSEARRSARSCLEAIYHELGLIPAPTKPLGGIHGKSHRH